VKEYFNIQSLFFFPGCKNITYGKPFAGRLEGNSLAFGKLFEIQGVAEREITKEFRGATCRNR
jgi:hypothetical protein